MLGGLVLVLLAASAVQGLNEPCTAGDKGPGTCISTADCQGLSVPGFCPGPTKIQCCTFPTCTMPGLTPDAPSVAGVCKKTSFCNTGPRPGFCPGPANVQCCPGGSVPNPEPPGPNPEPPGPNPEPPGPDPEPPGPNPEPPGPDPEPPGPNPPNPVPGPMVPIPPEPTDDSCTVGSTTGYCVDTFFCKGTVTAGACPGRPSNVKCCTAQPDANAVAGMDEYLPALAVQWGAKASVNPYRVFQWLRRDLAETIQGGQARFGRNYPGDASVGRSWLIGRQEQMWFRHNNPGRGLGSFSPPSGTPRMTSTEIDGAGENAKVTQLLIDFARALKPLWPGVHLGTYAGHGGGSFNNAGYSTDLTIPGRDDRGFFRHADAVAFCKKVHQACQTAHCDWRIIYNDFRVADEVNRFFGFQHNIFVGSARVTGGRATNLNWHGPLVLHFHLDIVPKDAPQQITSLSPATIPDDTRTVPLPPPPPPAGTGVPCQLPNNGPRGVCKNWRECDGTTTTGLCPGNSDIRCCTPRTFVETSSNTQRLPSRLRSIPKPAASDVSEEQDEHHRAENVLQP